MPPRRRWRCCLCLTLVALGCTGGGPPDERPNVLLVTLDTTRADHLGTYGYARDTSPALDRLARDGVVHTRAWSTSSWTLPAHASLFTGRFPTSHGALYHPRGPLILSESVRGALDLLRANPLDARIPTLAELLTQAGWATGAVVAGPWLKHPFGLQRGFQHYDDAGIGHVHGRRAAVVSARAVAWIQRQRHRPFFLFLNYFDAHAPYDDPEGWARRFLSGQPQADEAARVAAAYDGNIRYADRHLGRVLERLRELSLYERTWIIVTADHGELFGEHDSYGHGWNLYEGAVRIPLVIKPPGPRAPARSAAPIQLTDLLPLLAEALELPLPDGVQGRSAAAERPPAYAEVHPLPRRRWPGWRMFVSGGLKLHASTRGEYELYDLARDPHEERNLAGADPSGLRALLGGLESFQAALPVAAPGADAAPLDAGTREALRGLGYLDSGEPGAAEGR